VTEDLVRSRYEASIRPGVYESYTATFGSAPRQRHIAMLTADPKKLAAIEQEVLLLHGKLDQVIPVDVSLKLLGILKRSDALFFGNCGHWVQIERMASFNRVITHFMQHGLTA